MKGHLIYLIIILLISTIQSFYGQDSYHNCMHRAPITFMGDDAAWKVRMEKIESLNYEGYTAIRICKEGIEMNNNTIDIENITLLKELLTEKVIIGIHKDLPVGALVETICSIMNSGIPIHYIEIFFMTKC